jgi:hypothetical protein
MAIAINGDETMRRSMETAMAQKIPGTVPPTPSFRRPICATRKRCGHTCTPAAATEQS